MRDPELERYLDDAVKVARTADTWSHATLSSRLAELLSHGRKPTLAAALRTSCDYLISRLCELHVLRFYKLRVHRYYTVLAPFLQIHASNTTQRPLRRSHIQKPSVMGH